MPFNKRSLAAIALYLVFAGCAAQPMQAGGCTGHPSVEDHEILAKELIPFFSQLLRWNGFFGKRETANGKQQPVSDFREPFHVSRLTFHD